MKKEEILEKSRKADFDEMGKNIDEKANMYGGTAVICLSLIFGVYKILNNIPHYDISAIMFAYLSASALYRFFKLRKKVFLMVGISSGLITILFAISYMFGV